MEVPRPGVESQIQLPATATATATHDPSRVFLSQEEYTARNQRPNEGKIIFLQEAVLSAFISVLTKKLNQKQMFLEATS